MNSLKINEMWKIIKSSKIPYNPATYKQGKIAVQLEYQRIMNSIQSQHQSSFNQIVQQDQQNIDRSENLKQLLLGITNFPFLIEAHCIVDDEDRFIKRRFQNKGEIKAFINDSTANGSDIKNFKVQEATIVYGKTMSSIDKKLRRITRSRFGQGSDFEQIEIVENNEFFIPSSSNCFLKCITQMFGDSIIPQYKNFCLRHKIVRDKFPQKLVKIFGLFIKKDLSIYRPDKRMVVGSCSQYCLVIIDKHWIWLKNPSSVNYRQACDSIIKTQLQLKDASLEVKEYLDLKVKEKKFSSKQKKQLKSIGEQLKDCWVADTEAFKKNIIEFIDKKGIKIQTADFEQYAAGCLQLDEIFEYVINKDYKSLERDIEKLTHIFPGQDSIQQMINHINEQYPPKQPKKQKSIATVYMHNAKGYDNYQILEQQGIKFKKIIKSGSGIIALRVSMPNCYIDFKCSMSHLSSSLRNLCDQFELPPFLKKSEMDHNSVTQNNWESLTHIWKPYLNLDIVSLGIIMVKYMQNLHIALQGIPVKDSFSAPNLVWNKFCFDCVQNKTQLYQFTHPLLKAFLRSSVHGGRCTAYKKEFKSQQLGLINSIIQKYIPSMDFKQFSVLSQTLKSAIKIVCDACIGFRQETIDFNKQPKTDKMNFRDAIIFIKTSKPIFQVQSELVQNLNIIADMLMAFDATSLYPSAMSQIKYFPDISTARYINQQELDSLQITSKSFIIQCDIFLPKDLKFIPVCYKNKGISKFVTGCIKNQTYNDIDISEIIRFGGKIMKIYQGLAFEKQIDNPLKTLIDSLFQKRLQAKAIGNTILDSLYKLCMNSLYGKTVQKDIMESMGFTTSQKFADKQFDQNTQNFTELNNGQIYYVQKLDDSARSCPSILGSYILAYSKRIINNFVMIIGGDRISKVYYQDTDSLYIHLDNYQILKDNNCVGGNMGQGKNDYGNGGIIYAKFYGPKQKICYTIEENTGYLIKHMSMKGVQNSDENVSEQHIQTLNNEFDLYNSKSTEQFESKKELYKDKESESVYQNRWIKQIGKAIQFGENNLKKVISAVKYTNKMNYINGDYQIIHLD